jgi:hypothetical protein
MHSNGNELSVYSMVLCRDRYIYTPPAFALEQEKP